MPTDFAAYITAAAHRRQQTIDSAISLAKTKSLIVSELAYVCQPDVPATQGAQTFEAFQETLAGAQRFQPTRGAQAILRRNMTSFDWLGRLPSRAMQPAPNVHSGWHAPLDRLEVRLMVIGDDRTRDLA